MKTEDIPGALPQCVKFSSTRGASNPLNPQYKLQSVAYLEPESTKFIKNPLDHHDIDGSVPVKSKQHLIATRDNIGCKDIEGSHPKNVASGDGQKGVPYGYNPMDYRDVTKF